MNIVTYSSVGLSVITTLLEFSVLIESCSVTPHDVIEEVLQQNHSFTHLKWFVVPCYVVKIINPKCKNILICCIQTSTVC